MSGHSKWATIKRKKGAADAKRGAVFGKLSRAIIVAAKEGGPNPSMNIALANAIEKAKGYNMPNDNIDRAIKKATGGGQGTNFEHMVYEGYAPAGVAVLVEIFTDNKNRTAADVRSIFSKGGGSLGTTGSVAYMFERKGSITVEKSGMDDDEFMLMAIDAGAEDIDAEGDSYEITTDPSQLHVVKEALEAGGFVVASAEISMQPTNTVPLAKASEAKKVLNMIENLEDHDDVQEVYANFDIPDEIMESLS